MSAVRSANCPCASSHIKHITMANAHIIIYVRFYAAINGRILFYMFKKSTRVIDNESTIGIIIIRQIACTHPNINTFLLVYRYIVCYIVCTIYIILYLIIIYTFKKYLLFM